MITRPLDLASKLRPEPVNFGALFFVNVGLLVLFFSIFGSRFVLAPGLGIQLPSVAGAMANARSPTHVINITSSGLLLTNHGPQKWDELVRWLKAEGRSTPAPILLARVDAEVPTSLWLDVAGAAAAAGFEVVLAVEEPKGVSKQGGR
jgi:biopolymer transport protein ExbD